MEKNYYYKVYLEVVLKGADFVFGFINISNIPYSKLEELFRDQVIEERFLFDDSIGYFIEEKLYLEHKEYLDKNIPFTFDFDLFVYSVGLTSVEAHKYNKDYYEYLPPLLG
ncbi:hypothetical protein [Pedobacter nototheniae]|uniref:hypothetical protein n=1 Tax=Pedobacter nototheniae TaxID=2488994 RepID=UPI0010398EEE|nr:MULTISPECIES: hypothetical protein [Pedobacter]